MAPSSSAPPSTPAHPKINKIFGRNRASHHAENPPPSAYIPPAETSTANHPPPSTSQPAEKRLSRNNSKVLVATDTEKEKRKGSEASTDDGHGHGDTTLDDDEDSSVAPLTETPIIVEPPPFPIQDTTPQPIPRPGRRSVTIDRPQSMIIPSYDSAIAQSSPATARLTDISSRLSGWFSQGFAGASTTDLQLPPSSSTATVVPQVSGLSPKHKASGIFNVARHPANKIGGGLEKAVRYLFDSDSQPDRCQDPIWIMGVQHPGYEPPSPTMAQVQISHHRRDATEASGTRRSTPPTISRGSTGYHKNPSLQSLALPSSSQSNGKVPLSWPPEFYEDFTSCIWMTYRSQYLPIRDITLTSLEATAEIDPMTNPQIIASPPKKWWGGEKTWTTDSGWGCMLRTGQSLLATALVQIHLGRDWRRPMGATLTPEYATYVKLLTWFLDSPSVLCPFSVHRMALAGKELGTDVGCWFGPSIAAGAIKKLAHAFPEANLSVSVSPGGEVFESEIYAASHLNSDSSLGTSRRSRWGGRPVLVLIAHRLGIDGVNPVYYNGIKELFTWPQSVGISGGRPSSSYYFVGQQKDSLFYLDPHHTRPAIPLRPPAPSPTAPGSPAMTASSHLDDDTSSSHHGHAVKRFTTPEREASSNSFAGRMRSGSIKLKHRRNTNSPGSRTGSGSSNASLSIHQPLSPSPLSQPQNPGSSSTAPGAPGTSPSGSSFASVIPPGVEPSTYHFATSYPPAELKTYHCDKVRKMPLSALDPSMLLGFLIKTEAEWIDFRARVTEFGKTQKGIFSIHDEPPSWSDPDDLESLSDPEPEMDDLGVPEGNGSSDDFHDAEDGPRARPSKTWRESQGYDGEGSATGSSVREQSFTGSESFEDDDEDFRRSQFHPNPPSPSPEPKRSSTLTGSSKATTHRTDDSFDEDDEDWDSSLPSTSSPIAMTPPPMKVDTLVTEAPHPIPVVVAQNSLSPPHSRSSISMSPPLVGSTQYPFPRVPSPQDVPPPKSAVQKLKNRSGSGMRSLKGKDGGRTPSGGVLAIFNPTQEE